MGLIDFLRRVVTHAPAHSAVLSTGFASLSGLLLSLGVARAASITEMGAFAVGFAGYALLLGLTQAMVAEPLAARLPDPLQQGAGARQISSAAGLLGLLMALLGLLTGNDYLAIAGIAAHGVCLANYTKNITAVFGRPAFAVVQELARLLLFAGALAIPPVRESPLLLYGVWFYLYTAAGYVSTLLLRFDVRPRWRRPPVRWGESLSYGAEFLLGSGTTQISTFGLGAWARPSVNAGLRGVGTLLGPVLTLTVSGRVLLIPFLSRSRAEQDSRGAAWRSTVALLAVSVPAVLVINALPDAVLELALGDTWEVAAAILPIMSVEAVLALVSTVPFAGHRSEGAHRRTVLLRAVVAPFRVAVIVLPGIWWGPVGAATGTLVATVATTVLWWGSYLQLTRRHEGLTS